MKRVGLSLLILFALAAYLSADDFLQTLKQREEQITALSADLEMTIKTSPKQKITQKGKYYYKAPDKLRMDITWPVSQSMLMLGQQVYMKPAGSSQFIQSSDNDIQAKLYTSDLFGYYYLNQYVYEQMTNQGKGVYTGYEIIDNEKVRRVKVSYDPVEGVVKEYNIIGNAVITGISVKYEYERINGILVPVSISTRMNYQMGEARSEVRLKNVEVNGKVDEKIFIP